MSLPSLPAGAWIGQILCYKEETLVVAYHQRKVYIRTHKGEYPICPVRGIPYPDPDEGKEASPDLESLGLYYGYTMPETGWGSEGMF